VLEICEIGVKSEVFKNFCLQADDMRTFSKRLYRLYHKLLFHAHSKQSCPECLALKSTHERKYIV